MSVYYGHDIFRVPPCKKIPKVQFIVRPNGPKGSPGLRCECDSFDEAHSRVAEFTALPLSSLRNPK